MNRAWFILALALSTLLAWGGFIFERHLIAAVDKWGDSAPNLNPTLAKVDQALDTVNQPCGGGHPCGTLANVSKTIVKVGDIAVTTQRQVQQSAILVDSASASLTSVSAHLNQTADALTGTAQSASGALDEGKRTLAAVQPVLGHVDALVDSPDIRGTISNIENITAESQAIMGDARRVADEATAKYFKSLPWYRKAIPFATAGAKIAAYALPW